MIPYRYVLIGEALAEFAALSKRKQRAIIDKLDQAAKHPHMHPVLEIKNAFGEKYLLEVQSMTLVFELDEAIKEMRVLHIGR